MENRTTRLSSSLSDKAAEYRHQNGRDTGYVIIGTDGDVAGWTIDLSRPYGWMPCCIAIDKVGNQWLARGGDDYNGAKRWEEIK